MAYVDPNFEARRKAVIAGTANQQTPTLSQPVRTTGGFVDDAFEKRRVQILSNPLPQVQPVQVQQPEQISFGSKVSRFFGVETGELANAARGVRDFITADREAIAPEDVINFGKATLDKIKGVIASESEKYAQKEQQYRLDQNIPDYQALTFDQTIDLNSVGMLKLAREDIQPDLDALKAKENKSWLDNYRIRNLEETIKQIDTALAAPPGERKKQETFITGLAIARVSQNLTAGFLGSLEGVADFIQWRGDVAQAESVSKFGETTARHLNEWAEVVAPDNPNLSDEILQGAGSTLAFYIPGAGVSSATARLATISPRIATLFGVTASATLEAATESGSTYVDMVNNGFSREEADTAASRVFAGNIVFNVVSDKVGLFSDAQGVKKALTTALAEGSQEAFQDGLQSVSQKQDLDPDQLGKTFFIGMVVGGGLGSVVQNASVSEDLNPADREKLAKLAEDLKKVEDGADPEMLGYEFVNNQKPVAKFVDQAVFAGSIDRATPGGTKNINEIEDPEYAKGEISQQQVNIVKEQVRNGDPIDPIVLDPDGNVLDGAHRLQAFREMGVKNVDYIVQQPAGSQQQQFDYSSTQLDLPQQVAGGVTSFAGSIPENELYKDPQANYGAQQTGRENEPHITVLYGLNTTNDAQVRELVEASDPIEVELGEVSAFTTNEDYDVLKIDVISKQLSELNSKLDNALETPGKTFNEYQPHVTIAYLRKGEAQKYIGDSRFKGQKITLNDLTFSSKDGKRVSIPLLGKTAENGALQRGNQAKETNKKDFKNGSGFKKSSKTENNVSVEQIKKFTVDSPFTESKSPKMPKVVYRGTKDGGATAGTFVLGKGLYTSSSKQEAKRFGDNIAELDPATAIPSNPLTFSSQNQFKAWLLQTGSDMGYKTLADFNKAFPDIAEFVKQFGYDGVAVGVDGGYNYVKYPEKSGEIIKPKSRLKQFPSVLSGLANKGAEKIDNFELRKPPKAGTEEFKLHKKIVGLIRKYAQTIGEGYTPRNALGVYFPKTKNIRVNNINNVTVAAHEIAHFLDYANGVTDTLLNTKDPDIQKEMKEIYQKYYPAARPDHQKRLQLLEGYATLLQKYTEQPTTITEEFPNLVKEFLQPGGKYYHKVVGDILTDLNQMIGEYQGLEALDKIGSRVTSEGTNIDKGSFLNFWQKLRTQIADEVFPVEVLAKRGKVGFTKEDPSLWVRAYSAINGIVNNNISTDRGYWAFTDLQNGFQKKYDFNWKTLIESTQRRGITDSFAHYLVARREYYLYQELDQLKAQRDQVEMLYKAFQAVDPEKMAEFDRDMRAVLAEDFGIDISETDYQKAKKQIAKLFENADKAYSELNEILENDGFDRQVVEDAYEQNKDQFKDEETMFDALTREDLNLLHNEEVQLIDKKQYARLIKRDGYASFKRQFYDEIVGEVEAMGAAKVGSTKVSSMIGRTGSGRTIINPLYSALANHSEITRKAMKQVVYNQMGKLGSSALMPNLMQQVPLKTTVDKNTGAISYPQEKDNNVIMARQAYKRVPILMDGEIKSIIDNLLTYKNIDTFTQLYTGLSRTFTAGTTALYPQFALTNFVVDQITATANSYNKYRALYSPMKEMLTVLRKKNSVEARYYEEYLVMGGERQTFTGWQRLEPKDLFKRISAEKALMDKAIDSLNKGIDILTIPSAKSEIFSRATEYINARKAGKSQIVALEEAGRVTAPFHHMGAWGAKGGQRGFGQTFIRGLPFFNASIQVLDQQARVLSTKEGQKRATFITIAVTAAYLAAITAMMDASDEQKQQYKDLEPEDLANFIYFPNPSGEGLIRVKMANTFSIPGAVMNMIIANKMFGANYGVRDAAEAATAFLPDQFNPLDPTAAILGWIPQVFKPVAHVIFNVKEYPKVTRLVGMGLDRKPPELQYNEGTSVFAKKLGQLLKVSPIKVDYLLTGYLGRASGFLTGKPGIYNPASSIMRDYYFTGGRSVRQFYETKEKNDKEYSAYQNLEAGYTDLAQAQVDEIYRKKIITDEIDDLLGEYRDLDEKTEAEKMAELRAKILLHIENLENGTKPRNMGVWVVDAKKRRMKNKIEKK